MAKAMLIEIYNTPGKLIKAQIVLSESTKANVSGLNSGLYILKVMDDMGVVHCRKLMIEARGD